MPLPNVNITIANGQLGRVAVVDDAVAGMVLSGQATEELALSTPVQLFSFAQLTALGIDEDTNPLAYKDVKAFYNQAGEGAELWIMLVSNALSLEDICDETLGYAKNLLDAAAGRIRLLGINRELPSEYDPIINDGLDPDVFLALANLEAMAGHYSEAYKPFRSLLPGLLFDDANVAQLRDLKENSDNHVAIMLGCDTSDSVAIGLALGRLAAIPVQRNIARVKDGDVGLAAAYFHDGTPTADMEANWGSMHDKGYIFFRRIYGKSGFFFTDDPTATADTDDFSSIARGRVIDKALVIAYRTFVEELNEEIPVKADTGYVAHALIAAWKTNIEQALGINMTAKKEIVKAECYIDPNQNVLATDTIYATIKILPVGYAKFIEITLGLSNPYNTTQ
jgi:hypothetical protein